MMVTVTAGADIDFHCFLRGTRFLTSGGEIPVEDLAIGALVETLKRCWRGQKAAPMFGMCVQHAWMKSLGSCRCRHPSAAVGKRAHRLWASHQFLMAVALGLRFLIGQAEKTFAIVS
jgi:hypothetical protein